jgi:hypothetical protein
MGRALWWVTLLQLVLSQSRLLHYLHITCENSGKERRLVTTTYVFFFHGCTLTLFYTPRVCTNPDHFESFYHSLAWSKNLLVFVQLFIFILVIYCSETTLTGESRFHISPPRGFEPVSLVAGSKQVVHWTSETWWESCEIAGSPQGSPPPAADTVGCEARRETCSECETGTGKLCDQVNLGLHIVGAEPSEAPWGWRSQWSDQVGVTNVARQR